MLGVTLIAEHDRLYDFVSEQFDTTSDPVNHDTTLRLDGSLNPYLAVHLPFSLTADHTEKRSGDTTSALSGRLSGAIGAATLPPPPAASTTCKPCCSTCCALARKRHRGPHTRLTSC